MKHSFHPRGLFALLALIAVTWPLTAGYAVEKTAKYYFDRGTEHMEQGRCSQAVADLTRAIQMDPNYDKAYRQRGNVYFRRGDHEQAIADYTRAMRVAPKVARSYANRALVYLEQGKLDEALADFNEAIALDPKYAKAYSRRGRVYYQKGEYDKAIADCDQALQLDPKLAEAYFYKALACEEAGRYTDAIAAFRNFVKFAPPPICNPGQDDPGEVAEARGAAPTGRLDKRVKSGSETSTIFGFSCHQSLRRSPGLFAQFYL